MSLETAEPIVRALLLEGHLLYPYRASSLKNRQRWAFGTLYPKAFCVAADAGDAQQLRTECIVSGDSPTVRVVVRFMQVVAHGDTRDAIERSVETGELALALLANERRFESRFGALHVLVTFTVASLAPSVWKLTVCVENATESDATLDRAQAELAAVLSPQTVFECRDGAFASQIDPPQELCLYTFECRSAGTWPVLVGTPGSADTLLSSPIILPDHPQVAPASPGDLHDATEIDEILSLRILTMTAEEREEARRADPRVRTLIERTESLGENALLALHGICEVTKPNQKRAFSPGDQVILRPSRGGDVFDLALSGEPATVLGIEEDVDGRVYYTVTVDADPGRDLGALGQPGHRFFFSAEELERVT